MVDIASASWSLRSIMVSMDEQDGVDGDDVSRSEWWLLPPLVTFSFWKSCRSMASLMTFLLEEEEAFMFGYLFCTILSLVCMDRGNPNIGTDIIYETETFKERTISFLLLMNQVANQNTTAHTSVWEFLPVETSVS